MVPTLTSRGFQPQHSNHHIRPQVGNTCKIKIMPKKWYGTFVRPVWWVWCIQTFKCVLPKITFSTLAPFFRRSHIYLRIWFIIIFLRNNPLASGQLQIILTRTIVAVGIFFDIGDGPTTNGASDPAVRHRCGFLHTIGDTTNPYGSLSIFIVAIQHSALVKSRSVRVVRFDSHIWVIHCSNANGRCLRRFALLVAVLEVFFIFQLHFTQTFDFLFIAIERKWHEVTFFRRNLGSAVLMSRRLNLVINDVCRCRHTIRGILIFRRTGQQTRQCAVLFRQWRQHRRRSVSVPVFRLDQPRIIVRIRFVILLRVVTVTVWWHVRHQTRGCRFRQLVGSDYDWWLRWRDIFTFIQLPRRSAEK